MRSFLTITTPATDYTLLTLDEMREAVGGVTTEDAKLRAMEARCAASIMTYCCIAAGDGKPTLRREALTETFYQACGETLMLSRRHGVEIASIVEDGVTLLDTDFIVNPESGMVTKLCDDYPAWWSAKKVTIVFDAGFSEVPGDLKAAAIDFLSATYREAGRDPMVKSERVNTPGVEETEYAYWVGPIPGQSDIGAVPDLIAGQLVRFINITA